MFYYTPKIKSIQKTCFYFRFFGVHPYMKKDELVKDTVVCSNEKGRER